MLESRKLLKQTPVANTLLKALYDLLLADQRGLSNALMFEMNESSNTVIEIGTLLRTSFAKGIMATAKLKR